MYRSGEFSTYYVVFYQVIKYEIGQKSAFYRSKRKIKIKILLKTRNDTNVEKNKQLYYSKVSDLKPLISGRVRMQFWTQNSPKCGDSFTEIISTYVVFRGLTIVISRGKKGVNICFVHLSRQHGTTALSRTPISSRLSTRV